MPEYVYALHDFVPEHEDEIAFEAGQHIEVIEKDDQYSDGWWQVSSPSTSPPSFPKHTPLPGRVACNVSSTACCVPSTLSFVDVAVHSVLTIAPFQGP